jgi:hypothetical protein
VARIELDEIVVASEPALWRELGFVVEQDVVTLGGVRIRLGAAGEGIVGWSLRGLPAGASLDGLPTVAADALAPGPAPAPAAAPAPAPAPAPGEAAHPLGAIAVDHVVALTPDFDRTLDALRAAGLDYRRTREAGGGFRQAFFVLGPCLLELGGPVEDLDKARFWGLTLVVEDLDAAAELLGDRLGRVKDAVQPGRRIATVQPSAGLGVPLALITPR